MFDDNAYYSRLDSTSQHHSDAIHNCAVPPLSTSILPLTESIHRLDMQESEKLSISIMNTFKNHHPCNYYSQDFGTPSEVSSFSDALSILERGPPVDPNEFVSIFCDSGAIAPDVLGLVPMKHMHTAVAINEKATTSSETEGGFIRELWEEAGSSDHRDRNSEWHYRGGFERGCNQSIQQNSDNDGNLGTNVIEILQERDLETVVDEVQEETIKEEENIKGFQQLKTLEEGMFDVSLPQGNQLNSDAFGVKNEKCFFKAQQLLHCYDDESCNVGSVEKSSFFGQLISDGKVTHGLLSRQKQFTSQLEIGNPCHINNNKSNSESPESKIMIITEQSQTPVAGHSSPSIDEPSDCRSMISPSPLRDDTSLETANINEIATFVSAPASCSYYLNDSILLDPKKLLSTFDPRTNVSSPSTIGPRLEAYSEKDEDANNEDYWRRDSNAAFRKPFEYSSSTSDSSKNSIISLAIEKDTNNSYVRQVSLAEVINTKEVTNIKDEKSVSLLHRFLSDCMDGQDHVLTSASELDSITLPQREAHLNCEDMRKWSGVIEAECSEGFAMPSNMVSEIKEQSNVRSDIPLINDKGIENFAHGINDLSLKHPVMFHNNLFEADSDNCRDFPLVSASLCDLFASSLRLSSQPSTFLYASTCTPLHQRIRQRKVITKRHCRGVLLKNKRERESVRKQIDHESLVRKSEDMDACDDFTLALPTNHLDNVMLIHSQSLSPISSEVSPIKAMRETQHAWNSSCALLSENTHTPTRVSDNNSRTMTVKMERKRKPPVNRALRLSLDSDEEIKIERTTSLPCQVADAHGIGRGSMDHLMLSHFKKKSLRILENIQNQQQRQKSNSVFNVSNSDAEEKRENITIELTSSAYGNINEAIPFYSNNKPELNLPRLCKESLVRTSDFEMSQRNEDVPLSLKCSEHDSFNKRCDLLNSDNKIQISHARYGRPSRSTSVSESLHSSFTSLLTTAWETEDLNQSMSSDKSSQLCIGNENRMKALELRTTSPMHDIDSYIKAFSIATVDHLSDSNQRATHSLKNTRSSHAFGNLQSTNTAFLPILSASNNLHAARSKSDIFDEKSPFFKLPSSLIRSQESTRSQKISSPIILSSESLQNYPKPSVNKSINQNWSNGPDDDERYLYAQLQGEKMKSRRLRMKLKEEAELRASYLKVLTMRTNSLSEAERKQQDLENDLLETRARLANLETELVGVVRLRDSLKAQNTGLQTLLMTATLNQTPLSASSLPGEQDEEVDTYICDAGNAKDQNKREHLRFDVHSSKIKIPVNINSKNKSSNQQNGDGNETIQNLKNENDDLTKKVIDLSLQLAQAQETILVQKHEAKKNNKN